MSRQYVFEFHPDQDEWQVCSTGDDHEIVCAKGFDTGYVALASWVMEREAFSRFGHNEKWITVESEDGPMHAYGPAERLSAGPVEKDQGDD